MRTINADDFFKTFPELDTEPYNNFQTVDAVPVVRCKDCKHSEVLRYRDSLDIRTCILSARISIFEYDFCSRGERREEDNE